MFFIVVARAADVVVLHEQHDGHADVREICPSVLWSAECGAGQPGPSREVRDVRDPESVRTRSVTVWWRLRGVLGRMLRPCAGGSGCDQCDGDPVGCSRSRRPRIPSTKAASLSGSPSCGNPTLSSAGRAVADALGHTSFERITEPHYLAPGTAERANARRVQKVLEPVVSRAAAPGWEVGSESTSQPEKARIHRRRVRLESP